MTNKLVPREKLKIKLALRAILGLRPTKDLTKKGERYRINKQEISELEKKVLNTLSPIDVPPPGTEDAQKPSSLTPAGTEEPPQEKPYGEVIGDLTQVLNDFNNTRKKSNNILIVYVGATILMGLATVAMALFTWNMAESSKDLAQWEKRPRLDIHFLIESPFKPKFDINEGIFFTVKKYLIHRDRIKFHVAVKNNWNIAIKEEELRIIFNGEVTNDEGETLSDRDKGRKEEKFALEIAPFECKIFPVKDVKNWFLKDMDLLNKRFVTKHVKLDISGVGISVDRYPYASFRISYDRFEQFKIK